MIFEIKKKYVWLFILFGQFTSSSFGVDWTH